MDLSKTLVEINGEVANCGKKCERLNRMEYLPDLDFLT